jgi:hypothetical protein
MIASLQVTERYPKDKKHKWTISNTFSDEVLTSNTILGCDEVLTDVTQILRDEIKEAKLTEKIMLEALWEVFKEDRTTTKAVGFLTAVGMP